MRTFRCGYRRPSVLALPLLLLLSVSAFGAPGTKIRKATEPVPNRYIVQLSPFTGDVEKTAYALAEKYDGRVLSVWKNALKGFWVDMPAENAARLSQDNRIFAVEEDAVIHSSAPGIDPTDPPVAGWTATPAWHLARISYRGTDFKDASGQYKPYSYTHNGEGVNIYLIDSGVWTAHQEFAGTGRVQAGYQAAAQPRDHSKVPALPIPPDPSLPTAPCGGGAVTGIAYHGTATASMAVGKYVGVAKGANLVPVVVLGCVSSQTTASVAVFINGLEWVQTNGQRPGVVSISLYRLIEPMKVPLYLPAEGKFSDTATRDVKRCVREEVSCITLPPLTAWEQAVVSVLNAGYPVVASANNQDGDACSTTPARLSRRGGYLRRGGDTDLPRGVITVGGISADGARWDDFDDTKNDQGKIGTGIEPGSNYGQCVDIWAPAADVPAAFPANANDYVSGTPQRSGTSFAAPIVAGVIARMMEADPDLWAAPIGQTAERVWRRLETNATVLPPSSMGTASPKYLVYLGGVTFTEQPKSAVTTGDPVTLTAKVKELAVTRQWYRGRVGNPDSSEKLIGQTGESLTTTVAGDYWVRISNTDPAGHYGDSNAATITVAASPCNLPVIERQPLTRWVEDPANHVIEAKTKGGAGARYEWRAIKPSGSSVVESGTVAGAVDGDTFRLTLPDTENVQTFELVFCAGDDCSIPAACTVKSDTVQIRGCRALAVPELKRTGTIEIQYQEKLELKKDLSDGVTVRWLYHESDPTMVAPLIINLTPEQIAETSQPNIPWRIFTDESIYPPKRGYYVAEIGNRCYVRRSEPVFVSSTTTFQVKGYGPNDPGGFFPPRKVYRVALNQPVTLELKVFDINDAVPPDLRIEWADGDKPFVIDDKLFTTTPIDQSRVVKAKVTDLLSGFFYILEFDLRLCDADVRGIGPGDTTAYTIGELATRKFFVAKNTSARLTVRVPTAGQYDYVWSEDPAWKQSSLETNPLDKDRVVTVEVTDLTSGCKYTLRFDLSVAASTCTKPIAVYEGTCELVPDPIYRPAVNTEIVLKPFVTDAKGVRLDAETVATLRFQWERGGVLWEGIGAEFARYTLTSTSQAEDIRLSITTPEGCSTTMVAHIIPNLSLPVCSPPCKEPTCRRRAILFGDPTRPQRSTVPNPYYFTTGEVVTLAAPVTEAGYSYEWHRRAGLNHDVIGSGETVDVSMSEAADYWVLTNTGVATESSDVLVTLPATASSNEVTISPETLSVPAGGTAVLTVNFPAADATTKYEWRRSSSYVLYPPVIGDEPTLTVTNLGDDDVFWCRVIHYDRTLNSPFAYVNVSCTDGLTGTVSALTPFVAKDEPAKLLASANGKLVNYGWYRRLPNESTPTFLQGWNGYITAHVTQPTTYFSAAASDGCGQTANLGEVAVHLCIPTLTQQPAAYTIVPPGTAVELKVVASPAITGQELSTKWYRTTDVYATTPLDTDDSFTTTLPAGTTKESFYAVVTADCGDGPTYARKSQPATIEYCSYPIINGTSGDQWLTGDGQWARLWITDEGVDRTYQWYVGEKGDISNPLTGKTSSFIDVSPSTTTKYWCRITSKNVCVTDSATITVYVCRPPSITVPPESKRTFLNGTVKLSVTADRGNNTEPLKYQWQQETSPGTWTNIAGATLAEYTTPPVTGATNYLVEVSAGACKTPSAPVTVEPCTFDSVVNASPAETLIAVGGSATLSLPVLYPAVEKKVTWYRGQALDRSTPLGTGIDINLTTGPLATTTSYWAEFEYQGCVSRTTTYTVNVCIPKITQQPAGGQYVTNGPAVRVSVTTDITPVSYEWWAGPVGNHFTSTRVPNGTGSFIDVTPTANTTYWVRIKGCGTSSIDSTGALVTVCTKPTISSQTASHWEPKDKTLDIQVAANGTSPNYQWYEGNVGVTTKPVGSNQSFLRITTTTTTTYWVKVSNGCGSVNSEAITISVCAPPDVTVSPASQNIFSGDRATFIASATVSTNTPLSYQWYSGTPAAPTILTGETSATFMTPPLTSGASYFVRVTSGTCVTDKVVTVGMCTFPKEIYGTDDKKIKSGETTKLDLVISPVPTAYKWYRGLAGDKNNPLTGWVATRWIEVNPTTTTYYWAEVQGSDCPSQTRSIKVEVCVPKITTQPASGWVMANGTTKLTVAADMTATYQWYSGTSGSGTAITGANSYEFTTPQLNAAANYWVKVTGSCGVGTNSDTATITICSPAAINGPPASTSVSINTPVRLFVTATGDEPKYQWYQGTSGSGTLLTGKTNSYLDFTATANTSYWVKVTGKCGQPVNSATAVISVCDKPTIQTQPLPKQVIYGGQTATLSVVATQPTGSALEYQWYNATTGQPIPGETRSTFTTPALWSTTSYYVHVSSGGNVCSIDSNVAEVKICDYAEVISPIANQKVSYKQSVRLDLSTVSPLPTLVRWYAGASGDRSLPLTNWTSQRYYDTAPMTTTSYWADLQNENCSSRTTTITLDVCVPQITTQPQSQYVAPGNGTRLTVVSNLPGSKYQWYQGTTLLTGQINDYLDTGALNANTSYWVRVSGSCGVSVDSNVANITMCTPPSIVYPPGDGSTGIAGRVAASEVTANGSNLTYQWYYGESGDMSQPISGKTTRQLSLTISQTVKVWVRVTGSCGAVNSPATYLSIYPSIWSEPGDATLEPGQSVTFEVGASGTYLSYKWYDGDQLIPNQTGARYTTPALYEPKMYRVQVFSGNMAIWSREAYVNAPE